KLIISLQFGLEKARLTCAGKWEFSRVELRMRIAGQFSAGHGCRRKHRLAEEEGFRMSRGGAAFHTPEPRHPSEQFRIEPVLAALRPEMPHEKGDLVLQDPRLQRKVEVRLAEVAIPLRDLVLQDEVIAEHVPYDPVELAVILVSVFRPVNENDVGREPGPDVREPALHIPALLGEIRVLEAAELHLRLVRILQEVACRGPCLRLTLRTGTGHAPMHREFAAALGESEHEASRADLDVVGMGPDTEQGQALVRNLQLYHECAVRTLSV